MGWSKNQSGIAPLPLRTINIYVVVSALQGSWIITNNSTGQVQQGTTSRLVSFTIATGSTITISGRVTNEGSFCLAYLESIYYGELASDSDGLPESIINYTYTVPSVNDELYLDLISY